MWDVYWTDQARKIYSVSHKLTNQSTDWPHKNSLFEKNVALQQLEFIAFYGTRKFFILFNKAQYLCIF